MKTQQFIRKTFGIIGDEEFLSFQTSFTHFYTHYIVNKLITIEFIQ